MKGRVTGSLLLFGDAAGLRPGVDRQILSKDGRRLRLRELRTGDRARLRDFLERCSAESLQRRFFRPMFEFPDSLLDQLTGVDGRRQLALIVTQGEGKQEEIVAEGRAVSIPDRPQVADVAFLVRDELQRQGIATQMLDELAALACRTSITHFSADVRADNRAMLALIRKSGRRSSSLTSHGVVHFEFELACAPGPELCRAA